MNPTPSPADPDEPCASQVQSATDRRDAPAPLTVAVVGAGAMGFAIATRIHNEGVETRVVDVSSTRVEECRALGLQADTDIATIAGADVVLAVVATENQIMDLVKSEVVMSGGVSGAILVVMSTIGPEALAYAAREAADHEVAVIDAPMTGGVVGASSGALTLFVAGDERTVQDVYALLSLVGEVRLVGTKPGDGQAVKLVNQMLASIHLVAAAEALMFADRLGLDMALLGELLLKGAGASWMLNDRGPRMAVPSEERTTLTRLAVFVKDSALVADAAEASASHAPLTKAAREMLQMADMLGFGEFDDSSVIDAFRSVSGSTPATSGLAARNGYDRPRTVLCRPARTTETTTEVT